MPRTDEAKAFYDSVYCAVQEIPYGKVTSYGHIAGLIGRPKCARQVGQALKHLPHPGAPGVNFHYNNVPWQRVINSQGILPPREDPSGPDRHKRELEAEGVTVYTDRIGRYFVNFDEGVGWFPKYLPSEEEFYESESEDEDDA